jgi:MazG family protein
MVDFQCKECYDFSDLLKIMKLLRAPGGCPWDREQTHESIRRNFLEETYEAVDAIDRADPHALCEELGDVLMQVVFHSILEEETGGFTMDDVVNGVCQKLIYRHPHVFGDVRVSGSGDVLTNWEVLKRREKGQASTADAMDAVARTLPALWRSEKIQDKAAKAGFVWPGEDGALRKLEEETAELRQAAQAGGPADRPHGVREEVGDVLFMASEIARRFGVDPEEALHGACDKFEGRFRSVEDACADGAPLSERSGEELLELWALAKKKERS